MMLSSLLQAVSPRRNHAALRGLSRRFLRNRRGIAAVEFAFVLPFMLMAYFGVAEVGQAVMINRKITQLNRALADLTAQATSISDIEMDNIFKSASTIMAPYTAKAPRMAVSVITIDSAGVAKVCWSEQRNSTALARGSAAVLPTNLKIASTSVVMATASYDFKPTVGYVLTGTLQIGASSVAYMRPRIGKIGGTGNIEQVERAGATMCPLYT